ncbi:MAG TPA: FecR domain-containing protein [Candidatus Sulfomarinibacteraceae bacterium]|nr:FecR domain-containing protein [Candidatus Sulfomarinibacteraceae bacterium]
MTDPDRPTDALDRLTAEIRGQRLDDHAVAAATGRVWARLEAEHRAHEPLRSCADVRRLLPAYAAGELDGARALLVGDHTRSCVPCRRALLELKAGGTSQASATDVQRIRRAPTWLKAAAAVLLLAGGSAVVYDAVADRLADGRLEAVVASADGSLQLIGEDETAVLAEGAPVGARQRLRTGKDTGAMLRLTDGSTVEMAPRSELSLRASRRGTTVALARGNVIVHAADQGRDRLRVVTEDCQVAVKGTIFAVNHGLKGSRVSVIEGEVEVRYGGTDRMLEPGQQVSTDPRLRPVAVADEIAWSVNADEHIALLRELTRLHHDVADAMDVAAPRTSTRLLDLAPPDTVVYIALPDITGGISGARQVISDRLASSDLLRDWWQREIASRGIDTQIEASLDRLQRFGDAVGDEVVVAVPASVFAGAGAPVILAELDDPADFRALLEAELAAHGGDASPVRLVDDPTAAAAPGTELLIWVDGDLAVAAPDGAQLAAVAERLRGAAASTFAGTELHGRLAERYAGGVEWLVGVDLARAFQFARADGAPEEVATLDRLGLLDATTFVLERRRSDAGSAVDAELRFAGPRRGLASWLAEPAPLASLDFVSANATIVAAAAAKDGAELFDELMDLVGSAGPDALAEMERFEGELGIDLRDDLAAALGGEGAFALDGPVLPLPTWKLVVEVYDPATLEHTLAEVLARADAELAAHGSAPLTVAVSEAGGRRFTTVSHPSSPVAVTWTTSDGFLLAGSNRAAVEHALSIRDTGLGLPRSAAFRDLLPDNGYTDCSALFYRNLSGLAGMVPPSAFSGELAGWEAALREGAAPGLVCVYGLDDRILLAGTGPSLVGLAPMLGLQEALTGIAGAGSTLAETGLSSPE